MVMTGNNDKSLRLLVVDPSDTEQCMMMSVLSERNCDIVSAKDLESGLKLARMQRPDVVIADHGLRLDGAELCRQIRQDPELTNTPVVLMSSFSQSSRSSMVSLFEAGCDQVLSKPFKPRDLHVAIQSALFRGEYDALIPVLHRTGEIALVNPKSLEQLIASGKILCFKRQNDVAVIDRDRIRVATSQDYCGPERRRQP